jgi:translation initiation factor 1
MKDAKIVWSSEQGDQRKKEAQNQTQAVDEGRLLLEVRRLTSGKGRTMMEIRGLPNNKGWNKKLAQQLKKSLGVGGAFKDGYIEVHTADFDKLTSLLDQLKLKWKKTGG